ncbi:MAG: zinc ribbon domain-containing protein [Legionellales bacterium]|nr:zinc ribbon domain-containing protein [Legionellales bacterium]
MPIYEYSCSNCHHCFDVLQKFSDEPIKSCPECAKNTVVRLVSAVGFQLKGSGWYATDFKDKGKPPQTSDHKAPAADTKVSETKVAEPAISTSSTTKGEKD